MSQPLTQRLSRVTLFLVPASMDKGRDEERLVSAIQVFSYRRVAALLLVALFTSIHLLHIWNPTGESFSDLHHHCKSAQPIPALEYHARQQNLARVLHSLNASAYIAEPGANAQYFGNISTLSWRLSERPLLLMLSPVVVNAKVEAKIFILTPRFESSRAKLLNIPHNGDIEYLEWAEEADPYQIAASAFSSQGTIFLDEAARLFIFDGFHKALPDANVLIADAKIQELRQRKSEAEIKLLKCASEATLLAIRAVHKKMTIGMTESEARGMMSVALGEVGVDNGGCLTLFGGNAAFPHGTGTDRRLSKSDLALFDCTGSLYGYASDVTRTVALPSSQIPLENLVIWGDVHNAQTMALRAAFAGVATQEVDAAARLALQKYDGYFTHRLGHGIGLEGHESPYIVKNSLDIIKTGHTFSNEPGVYIEGQVGIRLEDCFYVDANGKPVFLTKGVGGQALSPWKP
ncbi:hypothetical protein D9757_001792 [Collybiopsis confluens]|uniref:Peptidase M24 domain-containing protein n=1 Tax=Collybiopsis confluens TaxID=2823264 RepID=A0A8H5HYF8_9AGAR|nr:hypothetical protein D9757_001792 [Collybiopsis confluens]